MIDLYEYWIQNGHKALEKYCQEYINALPTINQTTADAIKNGNLMSNENIYVCEVIDTKAKTIFGIHRAFLNSIFKWGIDKNIHCFLREYIPYIEDGIYTIHKDGIIFWITEEDYQEELEERRKGNE